jgi:hypothetical protein
MECDSAPTSGTTALMSMAMASIMKVFLMIKKEVKGYNGEAKGGLDSGNEWKNWNAALGTYFGDASGLICMYNGSTSSLGSRNRLGNIFFLSLDSASGHFLRERYVQIVPAKMSRTRELSWNYSRRRRRLFLIHKCGSHGPAWA